MLSTKKKDLEKRYLFRFLGEQLRFPEIGVGPEPSPATKKLGFLVGLDQPDKFSQFSGFHWKPLTKCPLFARWLRSFGNETRLSLGLAIKLHSLN
jgi:hypothetical protein